ncbi:ParB/RepB/Spo0J family partition protein [Agrobacterium tumefaciens]|uniref:ParB/RepB/Spo0J family partition protein n=1 Tax=Agrobacterium tumefaciens TaxID=358 RepID=A0AA44F8A7_AGRTU|nr:ParB/RepB/Spo0J family partition protein [Agrobacterium tumefaciens]NSL25090.1 ParB/RepB/Spo0J family partition protein [Agrobacterium tumefaciens]NTB86743.1 ParB/RepB/Spo0J family partition protein [Agrobacterium tumefaciens]NTC21072.1 ParB/RepB/Spo0J family partition protein [Agrobacterium tumefaciens]NTC30620.1 ParB/RepB/Spo0J family partition protein [Agrobacterium tumefaciens]NTC57718.1 ParB/RepB/Spo0J family partition protein [Agrobacterium tumefaciens]
MNMTVQPQDSINILTVAEPTVAIQHAVEAIALNRLVPSAANVRRVNAAVGISELADSIEAHGLIHNLTVRKGKKGKYEVVAGSRRLAALRLLAKEGRLAGNADIPCNVRDAESDTELSLAENVQREAMHIVDEILSYRQLAEDGMAAETIAARFGQSVITVRQRLKLANLSPKVLEVIREDGMSFEQAKALAISDSHDEQERVWFESPSYNRDPRTLRAMLTSEHVRSTDRLARFVGLEVYEAAGGTVLRDLFNADSSTFLTDQPLLTKLAMGVLEQAVEPLKSEGWGWVQTSLDASVMYGGGFGRIYPQTRELTEEEQAELSALGESFDELQSQIDAYAEGDPAIETDEARLAAIEQRITALQNTAKAYQPQEMALAGCIVYLDPFGAAQVGRGYVKAEHKTAFDQLQRGEPEDSHNEEAGAPSPSTPEAQAGYSAALVEELTAIRTAAMRVELANRPAIALAALLYPLVGRIFHTGYMHFDAAVEVSGQRRELAPSIKEPEDARALGAWLAMKEAWGDTLPGQPADLWAWLLDQSTDKLLELLAFVTAANLNAVDAKHDQSKQRLANAEQIAEAVGLDMRNHWTADATFLSRLSKAGIAEVLDEAGCEPQLVRVIEKASKADAVAEAEKQLAGNEWLPRLFRKHGSTD